MPRVPRYDEMPRPEPTARGFTPFAMPSVNPTVPTQIQEVGEAISTTAGEFHAIAVAARHEGNVERAKVADNEMLQAVDRILWDPESGYMHTRAGDAFHGGEAVERALSEARDQVAGTIKSPAAAEIASPVLDQRMANALREVAKHRGSETRTFRLENSQSRALLSLQDAAKSFEDDEKFAVAERTAAAEAEAQGRLLGWSDETVDLAVINYISDGQKMRYEAWRNHNPVAAFKHFRGHEDQIEPAIRGDIGNTLFDAAAPQLADMMVRAGISAKSPETKVGIPIIDELPADWRADVFRKANALLKQDTTQLKAALNVRVNDAVAAYERGLEPPDAPSKSEFVAVYGAQEGAQRFESFASSQRLGAALRDIRTLPNTDIDDMLAASQPKPGEGFSYKQRNFEALAKAAESVRKRRDSDPIGYARELKDNPYRFQPFSSLDSAPLAETLRSRQAGMQEVAADYQTPPRLLSEREAEGIASAMDSMLIADQVRILDTARDTLDQSSYQVLMGQIAPAQPTIAAAGMYAQYGEQGRAAAGRVLRGRAALHPNKAEGTDGNLVKMPPDNQLVEAWADETGSAFAGKEKANNLFLSSARAIYAARSVEEGDYSGLLDGKRWERAVQDATGGIERYNGEEVVLPYGMDSDIFRDRVAEQLEARQAAGALPDASTRELRRLPLENVGDGRYLVRRGSGYLVDLSGEPVLLDLR